MVYHKPGVGGGQHYASVYHGTPAQWMEDMGSTEISHVHNHNAGFWINHGVYILLGLGSSVRGWNKCGVRFGATRGGYEAFEGMLVVFLFSV